MAPDTSVPAFTEVLSVPMARCGVRTVGFTFENTGGAPLNWRIVGRTSGVEHVEVAPAALAAGASENVTVAALYDVLALEAEGVGGARTACNAAAVGVGA